VSWLLVQSIFLGLQLLLHALHSRRFLGSCCLLLLFLVSGESFLCLPVTMMASTVDIASGKTEEFECVHQELQFGLNVANKGLVIVLGVKEEIAIGVANIKRLQPFIKEHLAGLGLIERVVLCLIGNHIVDLLVDRIRPTNKVLLQFHALSNDVASLGLLTPLNSLADNFVILKTLLLGFDQVATSSNSIHEVSLKQVIEGIKVEALMQKLEVDILGKAHQSDGLIFDLCNECLVAFILGGD